MVNDNCSICLEALVQHGDGGVEMEPIGAALCGHCFHVDCFWSWEQAKSSQNMRMGRYSAPCPCPVCNAPVQEFIRLYIDASDDKSEKENLKKELKCVKKKLIQERLRHQRTQKELLAATTSAARLTASDDSICAQRPRQKAKSRKPSFMQMAACGMNEYDDEIKDLCDTVRLLLSAGSTSPPPRPVTNQRRQQESSQFSVESRQPSDISLPPPPKCQSHSSRRNTGRSSTITSSPSGNLDISTRGGAPTGRSRMRRSATPRPDPPLGRGSTTSSRTTQNTSNRTSTADDASSLSLFLFPEYEAPSCHARAPQQESLETAEARLSSRLSRLSSGSSLDPPSLRN